MIKNSPATGLFTVLLLASVEVVGVFGATFLNRNNDCRLLPEIGTCSSYYFPMYYYDPKDGRCKAMVYSGCGGNANLFGNEIECTITCSGVTASGYQIVPIDSPEALAASGRSSSRNSINDLYPIYSSTSLRFNNNFDINDRVNCRPPTDFGCVTYKEPFIILRYYFDDQSRTCRPNYYCRNDGRFGGFDKASLCSAVCGAIYNPRQVPQLPELPRPAQQTADVPSIPVIVPAVNPLGHDSAVSVLNRFYTPLTYRCSGENIAVFMSIDALGQCATLCEYRYPECTIITYYHDEQMCTLKANCSRDHISPNIVYGEESWRRISPGDSGSQNVFVGTKSPSLIPATTTLTTATTLLPFEPRTMALDLVSLLWYFQPTSQRTLAPTPSNRRGFNVVTPPQRRTYGDITVISTYKPLRYYCGGTLIKRLESVDIVDNCAKECTDYKPLLRSQPLCYVFTYYATTRVCELQVNCFRRDADATDGDTWIIR